MPTPNASREYREEGRKQEIEGLTTRARERERERERERGKGEVTFGQRLLDAPVLSLQPPHGILKVLDVIDGLLQDSRLLELQRDRDGEKFKAMH